VKRKGQVDSVTGLRQKFITTVCPDCGQTYMRQRRDAKWMFSCYECSSGGKVKNTTIKENDNEVEIVHQRATRWLHTKN